MTLASGNYDLVMPRIRTTPIYQPGGVQFPSGSQLYFGDQIGTMFADSETDAEGRTTLHFNIP
jgi:hypothetical protein